MADLSNGDTQSLELASLRATLDKDFIDAPAPAAWKVGTSRALRSGYRLRLLLRREPFVCQNSTSESKETTMNVSSSVFTLRK